MPVLPGDPALSQNQAPAQLAWQNRPTRMPQFTGTGDVTPSPTPTGGGTGAGGGGTGTGTGGGGFGDPGRANSLEQYNQWNTGHQWPTPSPGGPVPAPAPVPAPTPRPPEPARPTTQLGAMSGDQPTAPSTFPTAPDSRLTAWNAQHPKQVALRSRMAQARQQPGWQPKTPAQPRQQNTLTDPVTQPGASGAVPWDTNWHSPDQLALTQQPGAGTGPGTAMPFGSNPPVPPQLPGQTPGNTQFARGGRTGRC